MNLRLSVALLPSEDDEVLAEREPGSCGVQKLCSHRAIIPICGRNRMLRPVGCVNSIRCK
jgi:hypothetical protein